MRKRRKPEIIFQSYNPYEARYPGLRVVSRATLHLIKVLRSNGYKVVVQPEDGTKLCYLAEKGLREFLADPIIALVVNASLSLILNLLSNWVYDHLKNASQDDEVNLIVEVNDSGQRLRYNHRGQQISDERFEALLSLMNNRTKQYSDSLKVRPPELSHAYPIYFEHTSQIVGWAENIYQDAEGLKLRGAKITDEQTRLRVQYDDLTGFSVGGIIQKSTCMICKKDYVECNHITGEYYDGTECVVHIDKFLIADLSVVKNPVNPRARVKKLHQKFKKTND